MDSRGLTLIEVLVALGIMALALVITAPMLSAGRSHLALLGATRAIADGLRDARGAAIALNRPVAFRLDLARRTFGYDQKADLVRLDPALQLTLFTTDDQQTSARSGTIRFFPDGGSSGGGVALAENGRKALVKVDWLSGDVSVSDDMSGAAP